MYKCECGREFSSWQARNAHQNGCPLKKHLLKSRKPRKSPAWNKGLTKLTDERIFLHAEKVRNTLTGRKGKPHTDETKLRISERMKIVGGGYRKGSGYGKKGYYKGYWCDSSWELAYVIYNLDHNIPFARNRDFFLYEYKGHTHKYFPDFIEGEQYIEIKGFLRNADEAKFSSVENLKVLLPDSMRKYLAYVIGTYGKDFTKLYESGGRTP